jgi:hypothetical protein
VCIEIGNVDGASFIQCSGQIIEDIIGKAGRVRSLKFLRS